MNVKKEMLEQEIEQWKNFYNNFESLADSMLVTALAFYENDKREEKFKAALDVLENLKEPLSGVQMFDSMKADIESNERIRNESKIALRTLTWVMENEDKESEGEPEKNISKENVDKQDNDNV